ncbi:MAG: MFS transporter [Bryobacteraceae bacterium]
MTTTAVPARISRKQAGLVALLFGLSVMSYFDRTIMSIAGPGIMNEFGLSETQMGGVYSAFLISYALLMIPGGRLADRFGPRVVLTGMAVGSALFTGLTALGGKPGLGALIGVIPSFILIRLALGVSTAPLYPACARMNANWMPAAQRARVQGIIAAGAGLGGAVSPILFTYLIGRIGWRLSFCVAALATGALGAAWLLSDRDRPEPSSGAPSSESQRAATPWRMLLTDRNILLLTLGYIAVDYFEYIFFFWIYYYFGEIRHLGANRSAIYTTVLFLTWLVMTPIGGWVCDRMSARLGRKAGLRIVGISGLLLSAILLFAGANVSGTIPAVAVMSLALGFASCSDVTFWAGTIEVAGEHVGAACGIMNSGGNLGGFVAPILTPFIASFAGWTWGLYFGSLVALGGAAAWLFIDPTRRAGTA